MREYTLETPVTQSCPDCGGAMRQERSGDLVEFRCHIGHRLTAETVLNAKLHKLDETLGAALAMLNERAALCRELGEIAAESGHGSAEWGIAERECVERAQLVRALIESAWTLPEGSGD